MFLLKASMNVFYKIRSVQNMVMLMHKIKLVFTITIKKITPMPFIGGKRQ